MIFFIEIMRERTFGLRELIFGLPCITRKCHANHLVHGQSIVDPDVGYVCLWSLKNSKYPEYVVETRSGAMCASFHPDYSHVLAVGLRDGTLAVYNVSLSTREPQFTTHSYKTRHMASVRQVYTGRPFAPNTQHSR